MMNENLTIRADVLEIGLTAAGWTATGSVFRLVAVRPAVSPPLSCVLSLGPVPLEVSRRLNQTRRIIDPTAGTARS